MKNLITQLYSLITFFIIIVITLQSCSFGSKRNLAISNNLNDNTADVLNVNSLTKTVPIGANSWVVNNISEDKNVISDSGISNWTSLDDVIRTYIKTGAGKLNIGLNVKSPDGTSKIKVTIGNVSKNIKISNTTYQKEEVGSFKVDAGYKYIEIQGLQKSGTYIVDIKELLLGGSAIANSLDFVPTNNFYFGRRGPSVHMIYKKPSEKDVKWFYNEVTVPVGEDALGSFFMVNGHRQGYFGMQVNSNSERRILFSIWSAFSTDDPKQIPDDFKVTNLGNRKGVTVQDFGNEGSGKQSFKVFNWKAGETYKFLTKGEPSIIEGSTDYTGYFYNPVEEEWQLIASLRRPKTKTYLTGLHSFLENFIPSTGFISRKVQFGNQWVYTTDNTWNEITNAKFSADATALNGDRFDYTGGVSRDRFFLQNCGFFDADISIGTSLSREAKIKAPQINFAALPKVP